MDFDFFLPPDFLPRWLLRGIIVVFAILGGIVGWFVGFGDGLGLVNNIGGALVGVGIGGLGGLLFATYIVMGLIFLVILAAVFAYSYFTGSA